MICNFDYLNAKDGALIELLHTAEERYPVVHGSIRGIPKGLLSWGRIFPSPEPKGFPLRPIILKIGSVGGLVFGMFLVAYGLFRPLTPEFLTSEPDSPRWVFTVLGVIFVVFYSFFLWTTRRRFPKSLSTEDVER